MPHPLTHTSCLPCLHPCTFAPATLCHPCTTPNRLCLQVALGDYNILPNYFEQNQAEALDPQMTVLDTLIQAAPDAKLNDLKQLLGRMLFSGSAMDKKVGG